MTVVTNLITNGGAETNTAGWAVVGTNTIARSTEQAHSGNASLKITYQDSASPMAFGFDQIAGFLTITDELHAFSYWVYVPAAWDGGQIKIRHGVIIGSFIGSTATDENYANMALRDQWQRISCVVNPDAADLAGRLDVCTDAVPTAGRFIYIDDAQVELGSVANPYVHTDGAAITAELYTGSGGGAAGGAALAALGAGVVGSGGGSAGGSAAAVLDATSIVALTGSYVPTISIIGGGP